MSYTIFTANPAALISQPGRAVNTFPSGLVRVDQTYLGLTSQATTHRATLAVGNNMPDGNSSPCIDGLKIFPEAQERRREDGFTEYIVSAYGRVNTTGSFSKTKKLGSVRKQAIVVYRTYVFNGQNFVTATDLDWVVDPDYQNAINILGDVLTVKLVRPINQIPSLLPPTNLIRRYNSDTGEDITDKLYVIGDFYETLIDEVWQPITAANYTPTGTGSFTPKPITWEESLISIESVNYGLFDEYTLIWEDTGGLINFGNFTQHQIPATPYILFTPKDSTSFSLIVGQQPAGNADLPNRITKIELWVYLNDVIVNGYDGKEYTTGFQEFPGFEQWQALGVEETLNASSGDAVKIIVKLTNAFGEKTLEKNTHFNPP